MPRPRNLVLAALLTTSAVVTVALVWFGLHSLEQQKVLDRQQSRERLENAAEAISARITGQLADAGERLSRWVSDSSSAASSVEGAVVVAAAGGRIRVVPPGSIPFVPDEVPVQSPDGALAAAEAVEFAGNQPALAAEMYRKLSRHADARIRADALLRLGRVLRNTGRIDAAMAAYRELEQSGEISAAGLPAELAGLDGQRLTRAAAGDQPGERRLAARIASNLDAGRWFVSRGQAEFYRELTTRVPRPESWRLAEALASVWQEEIKAHASAGGLRAIGVDGRTVIAMWRSNSTGATTLATFAEPFIARHMMAGFNYQLADAAGRRISGSASFPPQTVVRVIGDAQNPWMMRIWPGGTLTDRRDGLDTRFLRPLLATVLLFLWGTVYFMARAIHREASVARLQSDFVAAVSHEFRSPLTTVRQLSEMLEMDQVPSEERRRKYYTILADEARRLQRLVETLLNFGRMEAGAQQYHFEKLDVRELVDRAVREASGEEPQTGGRMRVAGPAPRMVVLGDADALTLALRNLVENGLKYSPGDRQVEVTWGRDEGHVSISVIDHGPGIPRDEQEAVFRKFVRGRSAIQASIKGTGVGLAMVQHVLTAHGGKVRLESEPGRGSTFTIVLDEAE